MPRIINTSGFDESLPLSTLARVEATVSETRSEEDMESSPALGSAVLEAADGALDSGDQCLADVIQPKVNFEGINNRFNASVPDTVGDVGPNHYVQMVNVGMAVFNKTTGERLLDLNLGQIWSGFPIDDCAVDNTDPIVQFADWWVLTQLTLGCFPEAKKIRGACYNCIAVSKMPDPTGVYYWYAFQAQQDPDAPSGVTVLPDYPKYGVWSNSYILTT